MSLFDQFNNTLVRNEARAEDYKQPSIPSTGYVSVRIKEEQNIFTKQKMNLNVRKIIIFISSIIIRFPSSFQHQSYI